MVNDMAAVKDKRKTKPMKAGEKYHHWRYGPVQITGSDEIFVELEILDMEGVVEIEGDPWNQYLEDKTRKFHVDGIEMWLHKNAKDLKKYSTANSLDPERYKQLLHQHYR